MSEHNDSEEKLYRDIHRIRLLMQAVYSRAEADLAYDEEFEGAVIEVEQAHHDEAVAWLEAEESFDDAKPGPWGSFSHLCYTLGRNPTSERRRLRAVVKRAEKKRS